MSLWIELIVMQRLAIVLVVWVASMMQAVFADEPKRELPPRWITAAELADRLVQDANLVVVDVRPEPDYLRCHVKGSLNASLSALPALGFLKDREIVLVGDGMDHVALEREADRLAELGFYRIGLLSCGWPAWRQQKGGGSGSACGQEELYEVDVNRLALEAHQPDLFALAFNKEALQLGGQLGLRTILIEPGQSSDQIGTIVAEQLAAYTDQPPQRMVILADPQANMDGLVFALQRLGSSTFYVLENASSTLQRFVQHQERLGAARKAKVERVGAMSQRTFRSTPSGCATCP